MQPRAAQRWVTLGALPLIPRQEPEVPAPPGICSKPCSRICSSARSARTLRGSFCGRRPRRDEVTLGALPLIPHQETEVPGPSSICSKPCGPVCSSARSARTLRGSFCGREPRRDEVTLGALPLIPHQETEVPAPPSICSKPCSPACSSARSARTLPGSFCGHGPRRDGVTLGALPLIPHQETEFPGPSSICSKPCSPTCSSARSARTLRGSFCGRGPLELGLR